MLEEIGWIPYLEKWAYLHVLDGCLEISKWDWILSSGKLLLAAVLSSFFHVLLPPWQIKLCHCVGWSCYWYVSFNQWLKLTGCCNFNSILWCPLLNSFLPTIVSWDRWPEVDSLMQQKLDNKTDGQQDSWATRQVDNKTAGQQVSWGWGHYHYFLPMLNAEMYLSKHHPLPPDCGNTLLY